MTLQRGVAIIGLREMERRLDIEFLAQPELERARDTFVARIQRGGKGLGARRNVLSATRRPLGATVTSTRIFPRTKGTRWGAKNERIVAAMAPAVMRAAVRRIEARWALNPHDGTVLVF